MRRRFGAAGLFAMALALPPPALAEDASAGHLPSPFVRLADIEPSIRQDIRYASAANFTGAPVPGYAAGECILTRQTAAALARVQQALRRARPELTLLVYDCYRPARAVRAFVRWAEAGVAGRHAYHHPRLARGALLGTYIARRSGHSRGHAVDLTLAPVAPVVPDVPDLAGGVAAPAPAPTDCAGPPAAREADGSLDMGTAYDCFDPRAHTDAAGLEPAQRLARQQLVAIMRAQGFRGYDREWWHFSHDDGDAGVAHDFPIRPRAR